MRFSLQAAIAALAFTSQISALNILLGNDDGFGSAQVRETYRLLKASGHEVLLVASADNQSGAGGRSVFTNKNTLQQPSEFNLIPAGAPALGTDPHDSMIWYYNGTPAACFFVGIDHVRPNFTKLPNIDLVVAGPNYGLNLGPFVWTLSGTAGYTYAAVGRGIPAISFSGGNTEQRSYQWINATTKSGHPDPATIQAQLAVKLVNALVKNTPKGQPILPQGYGLSVNTPFITSFTNDSCIDPPFIKTRMTGSADSDIAVYNATTQLFTYGNFVPTGGLNTCINGDCRLPSETAVLAHGCKSSVSVFTVDYDAPFGRATEEADCRLEGIVEEYHGKPPHHGPPHHWSARNQL